MELPGTVVRKSLPHPNSAPSRLSPICLSFGLIVCNDNENRLISTPLCLLEDLRQFSFKNYFIKCLFYTKYYPRCRD